MDFGLPVSTNAGAAVAFGAAEATVPSTSFPVRVSTDPRGDFWELSSATGLAAGGGGGLLVVAVFVAESCCDGAVVASNMLQVVVVVVATVTN